MERCKWADKADPTVQLSNIQMAVDCANICKRLNVKKFLCAGTVAKNVAFSLSHLKKTTGGMMYGVAKHACRIILEDYLQEYRSTVCVDAVLKYIRCR